MQKITWRNFESQKLDILYAAVGAAMLLFVAGCGGSSGHNRSFHPAPPPPNVTSPGSGLFVVDCDKQLAYVPLGTLDSMSGNGRVAVVDLSVDPDVTNPIKTVVVLSHPDVPTGTALDNKDSVVLAVSGQSGAGGFLDLIKESDNSIVPGSPFSFPTGSQSGFFGQVLFDPVRGRGIVATQEIAGCTNPGGCTGFSIVNPVSHSFSSIIPANYPETFAFDSSTNVIIDASDSDFAGTIGAVDVRHHIGCTLTDANIGGDNDGSSIDSTTNILVVSNEDGTATVINLRGSHFSGENAPPCQLNEGGTPPNSVQISALPPSTAGSAVNAATHQAFLIEDGSNGITLLGLPSSPVAQLTPGDIATPIISALPNDPNGAVWGTKGDPYAVAVSACSKLPNRGYAVDETFSFLVEVDLDAMKSNPAGISTPLPAGSCAGVATSFQCDNGAGVKFFPLPS